MVDIKIGCQSMQVSNFSNFQWGGSLDWHPILIVKQLASTSHLAIIFNVIDVVTLYIDCTPVIFSRPGNQLQVVTWPLFL